MYPNEPFQRDFKFNGQKEERRSIFLIIVLYLIWMVRMLRKRESTDRRASPKIGTQVSYGTTQLKSNALSEGQKESTRRLLSFNFVCPPPLHLYSSSGSNQNSTVSFKLVKIQKVERIKAGPAPALPGPH